MNLEKWSWTVLIKVLQNYQAMLNNFQIIKELSINSGMSIGEFEQYYTKYIERVGWQIDVLNKEIARRNKLVGVI